MKYPLPPLSHSECSSICTDNFSSNNLVLAHSKKALVYALLRSRRMSYTPFFAK